MRGILSSKLADGTTVPEEIRKRMDSLNYEVSQQLVCASNYGIPQKRYRFLIIGIDGNLNSNGSIGFDFTKLDELIIKNKISSEKNGTGDKLVVGEILKDIDEPGEYWEYSKTTQDMIEKIGSCEHGKDGIKFFKDGVPLSEMPQNILVFILPLTIHLFELRYMATIICTIATVAAVYEGHLIRKKN